MDTKLVEVYRTHDEVEANSLQDILQQEGVEVALLGPQLGNTHLELGDTHWVFEVPEAKAEQAAEIIKAFTAEIVDDGKDDEHLPWELTENEPSRDVPAVE